MAPSSATRTSPRRNRSSGERLPAYVELVGPVEPGWLEALRRRGVELLQYRSAGTYLGSGTDAAFRTAEELAFPFVRSCL